MLSVGQLAKNFAGLRAVADISFAVERGTIVSLIGPNGAGKTSVFNMITGFYVPDSGSICFEGRELSGQPPHLIARAGIARTFQNIEIFRDMSVEENVYVGCQCRSPVNFAAALVPFIRSGNTLTTAGSFLMDPMYPSTSVKLPVTSIAFSAVPTLAIFPSMRRRNSILSLTSGRLVRLD